MEPKRAAIWYLPAAVLVAVGAWVSWNHKDFTYDDPWITYRVAENLIAGKGFVYNEGENVLVTTTPLYTLLLAGLGLSLRDVAFLSFIIGAISFTAAGVLLFAIGKQRSQPAMGSLAGLLYLLLPLMPLTLPMETPLLMMLCFLVLYFALASRWNVAAALMGLAVVARPDAIALAGILLAYYVLCCRKAPLRESLVFLAFAVPWFAFSYITFGSPFPATLEAKQASLVAGWAPDFLGMTLRWGRELLAENWLYWLLLPVLLLGLIVSLTRERWVLIPFSWAVLHASAYQWLGVPWFPWYMAPFFPALVLLVGQGITWIDLPMQSGASPRRAYLVKGMGILLAVLLAAPWGHRIMRQGFLAPDPLHKTYRDVGLWLKGQGNPKASVGSTEFGIMGYYSELRMIDFPGLTNKEQGAAIRRKDALWSLFNLWPEYIVLFDGPPFDENLKADPRFQQHYVRLRSFPTGSPVVASLTAYGLWTAAGRPEMAEKGLSWNFGNTFELRGYVVDRRSLRPEDVLKLALTWTPLQRPPINYSVFAHLLDGENRMVAQQDNVLETKTWLPGREYRDLHSIQLPAALARGQYSLEVGVYRAQDTHNLPVLVGDRALTTSLAVANIEVLGGK